MVSLVQNFCTNDLGALYLDVTKDRLYTMQVDSHGRRSAQSAMFRIAEAFARWMAPVLSFTADEIWGFLPGERACNVSRDAATAVSVLLHQVGNGGSRLPCVRVVDDHALAAAYAGRKGRPSPSA